MKIYSSLDQATINELEVSRDAWSLNIRNLDDLLVELPQLVREHDLSEIITKIRFNNGLTIFNNVGTKANYAQLARWTENALEDEKQSKNADHQWKAIFAVLKEAQEIGIDYCSFIRGWEGSAHGGKGAAQGDQILKLLAKNLQVTRNHEIKSEIFDLILAEANKGESGLYAIPQNYKNNPNVKDAAAKHQEFVGSDEFLVLGVRWNTIQPGLESKQEEENHTSAGTSRSTTNQITLGNSNSRPSQVDIKQEIKKANKLLKEYNQNLERSGIDKEAIKIILETKDEGTIN